MVERRTTFVQEAGSGCLSIPTAVHLVVKLDYDMVALARAFLGSEHSASKLLRNGRPQVTERTCCTVNPLGQLSLIHFA